MVAGPSNSNAPVISDYERTFKPFVRKKDVTMAPTNWFLGAKKTRRDNTDADIIVIDDDIEKDDADDDIILMDVDEVVQNVSHFSTQGKIRL